VAAEDDRLAHIDLTSRWKTSPMTEALNQQKAHRSAQCARRSGTTDDGQLTSELTDRSDGPDPATQDQTALLQQQIDVEKERSAQLERALAVAQSEERTLGRSLANQLGLTFGIRAGMGKLLPTVGASQ
jgi:hypothetical protein